MLSTFKLLLATGSVVVLVLSNTFVLVSADNDNNGSTTNHNTPIEGTKQITAVITPTINLRSRIANKQQIQDQQLQKPQDQDHRQDQARIIGGSEIANPMVRYPSFAFNECGATLIQSDIILTAAHCAPLFEKSMHIYVGGSAADGGENVPIQAMFVHPLWSWETQQNDVMIMKLGCRSRAPLQILNWNESVPLIDEAVITIGYGATESGGQYSPTLNEVTSNVVDGDHCRYLYQGWIVDRIMICAGNLLFGGKDACGGDSGGPLLRAVDGTQIGIVSFGWECGLSTHPGVYTRIAPYRRWIGQLMQQYSDPNAEYC
jgi:secreted trypsin-like serine protease